MEVTTGNELTGAKFLLRLQGGYFLLTGIWPLVHMPSFLYVTGDKAELWLVETVGCLVIAIGLALLTSRPRPLPPFPINLLAVSSAAGLAVIDIIHVVQGVIRPVYLGDALLEILFIGWWVVLFAKAGSMGDR